MDSNIKRNVKIEPSNSDREYSLSIIVPVYNAANTLRQALDSLFEQRLKSMEIVIVNDGTNDNSKKIIEGYSMLHDNITVVTHEENSGYGSAMNDGIEAARGEWIGILEPDDYVLPNMYSTMLTEATKFNIDDIDIIKTPYIREVRAKGTPRGGEAQTFLQCSYRHRIKPKKQPFDMTDENASHLLRHHPSIWSALYKKQFLKDNDIEFVEYPGAGWADNEFFYKTLLSAKNIIYIDEPFYVYREETDEEFHAFTLKNPSIAFERWHSMMDIIEELGITNANILKSHISKGFTYLGGVIETLGYDYYVLNEANKMFARMDEKLVDEEKKLQPGLKRLYNELSIRDFGRGDGSNAHKVELIKEAGYAVRNNGLRYMVSQVKRYLGKKNKRG